MTQRDSIPGPLVVIGYGAMASAIVEGAICAGALAPDRVLTADPSPERREHAARLGLRAFERAADALRAAPDAAVLLAVKPQSLEGVARDCAGLARGRAVVSILAGATAAKVGGALDTARIVRAMPNTPARVRKGITAVAPGPGARDEDGALARTLLSAVGEIVEIPEALMDAFTAICGSGPAYVFYLAEAMTSAALQLGFDDATADRLVRATVAGAGALLDADRDRSVVELRTMVTSRGGTTAAATDSLDHDGVMSALERAVVAARDRGRELAGS